ncbi:hypothetical protein OC25_12190 [Pedobacter kyungheensis]|uniref:Type VI secretion system baseplate subunit TssK n=1 Tax=Pedobacter kyungheensis TaxID=1069985 RepID=A0A0C1G133_9SPHI|nr:hypothetical protein [Pedobacter kyungheensis]KIA93794.1 hypothetical protein OC25_12190 [Pedobacter kyungheensis]
MIKPLRYKSINWVNGMKLSSDHFTLNDLYLQDFVRDAVSLNLNNSNYGFLPPFAGYKSSHDIEIIEKATNHIEIRVNYCNALTSEGCHIDIAQANHTEMLVHNHYFGQSEPRNYAILLAVNPFNRVPAGMPNPEENPIRYPELAKSYAIVVLPESEVNAQGADSYFLTIGQVYYENGRLSINRSYIPPSSTVASHPALIRYYESLSVLLNDMQLACFKIIDKTGGRDNITPLGKNIRLISEKIVDYIAGLFYEYRNIAHRQPPVVLVGYFSSLAHIFFTAIKLIDPREREELLKYFYEWKDVTPGNFEELLAKTIELVYDHKQINQSMLMVSEFMNVMVALWNKLSGLEYIGQRKENIVVAEQQVVQQVQAKKTWTLLD